VADPKASAMQINVETMQGVVQLSGFVDSRAAENRAVMLAEQVRGVKHVRDNIVVRPGDDGDSNQQ
jgi:osmotically-inducible protein OsmY